MDAAKRIITRLPLEELWNARGTVEARRICDVDRTEVIVLIESGVTFVVADLGHAPRWIDAADRFAFWKAEVASRLADPDARVSLDLFPGGYCYFAAKWPSPMDRH